MRYDKNMSILFKAYLVVMDVTEQK